MTQTHLTQTHLTQTHLEALRAGKRLEWPVMIRQANGFTRPEERGVVRIALDMAEIRVGVRIVGYVAVREAEDSLRLDLPIEVTERTGEKRWV